MSFPDHSYDFQDSVYITTLGKSGLVQSIRQGSLANQWLYQLTSTGNRWWDENELSPACPHCFSPVAFTAPNCEGCGLHFIDE